MNRLFLAALVCFSAGCLKQSDQTAQSGLTQIQSDRQSCERYPKSRLDYISSDINAESGLGMPIDFLGMYTSESEFEIRQVLASLPDAYLTALYEQHHRNGFYIHYRSFLTTTSQTNGDEVNGPTDIAVNGRYARGVLRILLGYAVYFLKTKELGSQRQGFINELKQHWEGHRSNRKISQKAKQDYRSFFAHAFDSYYCSAGSREKMRAAMSPEAIRFFERELIAPAN